MERLTPTEQAYREFQEAYDFYNQRLFDNKLPGCMFTMQRRANTYGYFSSKRFVNLTGTKADEIALNPEVFAVVPMIEILQTLVHEMAHQWQQHYGKPGRRGYHNKEWGNLMESVGLMPSNTGKPGGRKTGEQMMDYLIEDGPFDVATRELVGNDFGISWLDRFPTRSKVNATLENTVFNLTANDPDQDDENTAVAVGAHLDLQIVEPNRSNRCKYICTGCGIAVWGKPKLNVKCGDCEKVLELSA